MSNATDRFKHQFEMILRDTIGPEIEIAKNSLIESIKASGNDDAPSQMNGLGDWAAERLKAAVAIARAEVFEVGAEEIHKRLSGDD